MSSYKARVLIHICLVPKNHAQTIRLHCKMRSHLHLTPHRLSHRSSGHIPEKQKELCGPGFSVKRLDTNVKAIENRHRGAEDSGGEESHEVL